MVKWSKLHLLSNSGSSYKMSEKEASDIAISLSYFWFKIKNDRTDKQALYCLSCFKKTKIKSILNKNGLEMCDRCMPLQHTIILLMVSWVECAECYFFAFKMITKTKEGIHHMRLLCVVYFVEI